MASITVVYNDIEEMKAVARILLKDELSERGTAVPTATPIPNEAKIDSTASISAGIAAKTQLPPGVITGQVPVAQTAPVVPVTQTQVAPPENQQQTTVPTSQKAYSLDELATAAMTLMDKGLQVQLQELLARFGVEALPMLSPEKYGNFATALREMGAQI